MLRTVHAILYIALTLLAAAVARKDLRHLPLAIALAALAIPDLVRPVLIGIDSGAPRPFHGLARLAFHIDEAIVLSWPLIMLACALHYFVGGRAWRWALVGWIAAVCLCFIYPYFSGQRLVYVYGVVGIAALVASWGCIVSGVLFRAALRPTLAHLVVILYAATDVGTWLLLFVQGIIRDWPLVLIANVLLLVACVVAHVRWLFMEGRRRDTPSTAAAQ